MKTEKDLSTFLQFTNKIGYDIGKDAAQNLEVHFQKTFDFMPELAMFMMSYTVKKTFSRQTQAPRFIEDGICFYFKNILAADKSEGTGEKSNVPSAAPCVHVFPASRISTSTFKKGHQVNIVTLFIRAAYLKSFLKDDAAQFGYLFNNRNDFLIEEIMTDDILRTVNELAKIDETSILTAYYYKLKAMELLFHLFTSLSKREKTAHSKLSQSEIDAIYKVRAKLISSLSAPVPISELKQIAAMNELKMRHIFIQVFGMGIYDYYQYWRIKEAARLLREQRLSVSQAGYELGFTNLSHFSRVFERHMGMKPKKYAMLS
ncbi:helix-turn-helix domain-containing protein [Pedobacter nutrimenti]|uniref:AraC-like DNA-binding protein n=1 Tax=Pedobacter nutrimenti TaxID=1241337 RepID=A0A318UPP5_9SPHI|nr:AraC family transcriptional regulator [Pedobacter nutrimenti]PYF77437.1 AraC-like DNA-binding protein [Pedobacter nutrimenti]